MAESQVLGGREALRVLEQTVLLDSVTAYMDVLRDADRRHAAAPSATSAWPDGIVGNVLGTSGN